MNTTLSIETIPYFGNVLPVTFSVPGAMPSRMTRLRRRAAQTISGNAICVDDCWVLNTASATQIEAHVRLVNRGARPTHGQLKLEVVDPSNQRVMTSTTIALSIGAGKHLSIARILSAPEATVWAFDHQSVYQLEVSWQLRRMSQGVSQRKLDFAFLEFAVEGVGRDEMFRLRNRKARLSAVIPWSCWSGNGLVPITGVRSSTPM